MVWLKIEDLVMDPKYYPREKVDPIVVWRYKTAMEAGAQFPPILVGKKEGKYIVLDGWHRVEAAKQLKRELIAAFITKKPEKEWFLEAVKANVGHGERLTTFEIIKAALKLEEQGFSREKISEIVRIPVSKLERFIAQKVVRNEFGRKVTLKAPLKHLSKEGKVVPKRINLAQEKIGSRSQILILDQMIQLLKYRLLNLDSKAVKERLREIKELIEKIPL